MQGRRELTHQTLCRGPPLRHFFVLSPEDRPSAGPPAPPAGSARMFTGSVETRLGQTAGAVGVTVTENTGTAADDEAGCEVIGGRSARRPVERVGSAPEHHGRIGPPEPRHGGGGPQVAAAP